MNEPIADTLTLEPGPDQPTPASAAEDPPVDIKNLPREVGVMLLTAGIVGFILPGPGTPAIIAGGIALWPNAFGKVETWFSRRYPLTHKKGMQQIGRFLNDLEKRYPNSTKPQPHA